MEFQVSEVVERLEAGVNAHASGEEHRKPESRNSTGFFDTEGCSLSTVLRNLEELVKKTESDYEYGEIRLQPKDSGGCAAILSHSLIALFGRLERSHTARLGAHIASETSVWLAHMFR